MCIRDSPCRRRTSIRHCCGRTRSRLKESTMKKRTTILAALIAATMAIGVIPALAAGTDATTDRVPLRFQAERPRVERTFPPDWIGQTADEIRQRLAERTADAKERIANAVRLTDEQKAAAIESLNATLDAAVNLDEPAAIIGTTISRRQLQRIE